MSVALPARGPRWLCIALGLALIFPWLAPPPTAYAAAPGVQVQGNQLVTAAGQPVRLLGVNRSGTEYACIQGWGIFDGPSDAASVQAIAAWHTTAVRVPLNEDCWLGINGAPAAYSGITYQQAIVKYVGLLNQYGLVAILDLHWTAPGTEQAIRQLPMPDQDHAPAFWQSVAATFKGNPAVVFDLFNEPYPDNNMDTTAAWTCWRDGGTCPGISYQAAGMQMLVTTVRNAGAPNVLILSGVQYANSLSQWLAYKPIDPQHNLAASWHIYNFNACNTTACYDSTAAPVAQQVPLIVGEIGERFCGHTFIDTLMGWMDQHGGSYLGWSWNTADCNGGPALITDYNGTPTQTFGQGFHDHMAALAATPRPAAITVTSPLALSATSVAPSGTLTGTATLQNTGGSSITLPQIVIAGRPPGGTNAGGPYDDFGRLNNVTLAPGQRVTIQESRAFSSADPSGRWWAYLTYETPDGVWHDGPSVYFSVGAAATPSPAVVVTSPLTLSAASVAIGASLTGMVTVANQGGTSIVLQRIQIAGRPPGGTNAGGPYDDFGGSSGVTLAPGQSFTVRATRAFTPSDPTGGWYAYETYQTADGVWHDDANDVTFGVVKPTFSSSATVSPAPVAHLAMATITATVVADTGGLFNGIVDLEVHDSAGNRVGQQYFTGQNLGASQSATYIWSWPTPATTGTYTVKVGVFGPDWSPTYHWNNAATTCTVN